MPNAAMPYQNMETADIEWVRDSVDRWGQPIAAVFSKYLLPRGTVLRFDWSSRHRTDIATQVSTQTALVGSGIKTTDEARASLGYPPLMASLDPGTTPAGVPELTSQEVAG